MLAANDRQPQFINGMYIGTHTQNIVNENILEIRIKPAETIPAPADLSIALPTSTDGVSDINLKKTDPIGIKDSVSIAVTEPDANETKDAVPLLGSTPANIQVVEVKDVITTPTENTAGDPLEEKIDPLITKYAEMVGLDPTDINNYPLYRFIDEWYGTRYRYGGADNSGIDCSAFSQKLYDKVYGVDIKRTARQQHRSCERSKNRDDADEGDLVFFRIHHILVSHVGVYLANGYFVHASRSQGVVISNLNTRYWQKRFAGCGKVQKEDRSVLESDSLQ